MMNGIDQSAIAAPQLGSSYSFGFEVDPLLCANCHSKMDIVSVIKDGKVIDKILAHLQYKFDPLPLCIRPPPDTPTEWDSHFI